MARPELGNIEQVAVRKIWRYEAEHFTPWLAKNIDQLGDALQMDLVVLRQEAYAGNFWLDILATDAETGTKVVAIENQLEGTDSRHLGQLLTYAAHYDARTLVWVSPLFRDVHLTAIEWLNRWLGDSIQVFGVEVSAIKIGNSAPAVEFRPVAFPASWRQ